MSEQAQYTENVEKAYLALMRSAPDEALDLCTAAAKLQPLALPHLYLLGLVSMAMSDVGRGIKFLEEGHKRSPSAKEFVDALAALHARVGNMSESIYFFKLALVSDPDPDLTKFAPKEFEDIERNIAFAGVTTYLVDAAIAFHERDYRRAVDLCGKELAVHPDNAECHQLMGRAWTEVHEYDEAAAALGRAVELAPGDEENVVYLGDALMAAGRADEAEAVYRQGMSKFPASVELRNRLVCAAAYCPDGTWQAGMDEVGAVSKLLVADQRELPARDVFEPAGDGKLVVGFLLSEPVLAEGIGFVESLFKAYDKARAKFIVYQQYSQPYAATTALMRLVDDWRETFDIDDLTLDLIIRNDGIDVLVDLCGVRPGHRQTVLSGKPAPRCVNWLGFPHVPVEATADAIFLDDEVLAGSVGSNGVETVSLGRVSVAYGGGSVSLQTGLEPSSAPDRPVTFGAFLDPARIVESADLWAAVLDGVPGSVLFLGANGDVFAGTKTLIDQQFEKYGLLDRVILLGEHDTGETRAGFLAMIDILLEPRYVNLPSLVCDAMWMGVPVVAIDGARPTARMDRSILHAAGHADWVAADRDEYVEIARRLADAESLEAYRNGLRDELKSSILCDEGAFAGNFLDALEGLKRADA